MKKSTIKKFQNVGNILIAIILLGGILIPIILTLLLP